MADGTKIEWTEATWNPITGCTVTSPGCTNCYAMKLAGTRLRDHPSRAGLTQPGKAGPVWTGEVRFNEQWLDQPLRWRRPRMIFVCAHGDLFHESVPDEWIDRVFAVMALCPQHTFQVLTKRSARMRDYISQRMMIGAGIIKRIHEEHGLSPNDACIALLGINEHTPCSHARPLPNVWLGVSVEDQARADERIPDLLATPAAVRWLSCEPLLGLVDLEVVKHAKGQLRPYAGTVDSLRALFTPAGGHSVYQGDTRLDWIVAGGESGPGARPMHPDWARTLRDQCAAAGVPFFFKQWGESCPLRADLIPVPYRHIGWVAHDGRFKFDCTEDDYRPMCRDDDKHRPRYWSQVLRVGKKAAGRLLDGVTHDGMPHFTAASDAPASAQPSPSVDAGRGEGEG